MMMRFYSSAKKPRRSSLPPLLRFQMDTASVFGSQKPVPKQRAESPNDFMTDVPKNLFEEETESLYGESQTLHRACSVPKGVSIAEQSRRVRQLFRIPRGQPASAYPQAYVPNKALGLNKKKKEK